MPTEAEIAWAAGLFEGEGSFCVTTRSRRRDGKAVPYVLAGMISTDRDVLEKFQSIVGVGSVTQRNPTGHQAHWKQQWQWQVMAIDSVRHLIDLFLPWFCERRRAKALEVLDAYAATPTPRISKTHCPQGHEFTSENTRLVNGWRRCRACERDRRKVAV